MAVSYTDYTSTTSKIKDFTFPYIKQSDIKVRKTTSAGVVTELVEGTATGANPGQYTWTHATRITLNDAPVSADTIRVYRDTASDQLAGTFYPGSAIRSSDLNDNFTQNLYVTQEAEDSVADAVSDASSALTKATTAETNAATALTNSRESDGSGGYNTAISIANTASTNATNAVNTANSASTTAAAAFQKDGSSVMTGNIVFEGSTNDSWETTLTVTDPTDSDKTITLPNETGTVVTTSSTNVIDSDHYVDGSIDNVHIAAGQITSDKLNAATVVTASEQSSVTANDTSFFTTSAADARYFNVSTGDTIKDGDTFPDNDTTIATTAAINDRIIDLVDDVGGFVPLVSEATFPAANPDVNNGAGTIVSIGVLGASYTPSSGTCTIPDSTLTNISGSNVTITDCGTTVLAAGFGCLVETTTTLHTYKFHRLTPKATEVTTVAGAVTNINTVAGNTTNINTVAGNTTNINTVAGNNTNITNVGNKITDVETVSDNITDVSNFADLYQIATSAPSTDGGGNSLAAGDLWFDSSSNKAMKVHNGTTFAAVTPVQSVLDDIAIVSGDITRQEDLGLISDAIASGTGTGALATCATNISDINTFAEVYRIGGTAPSSSVDNGDLWYDSSNNLLKVYNGTAWVVTATNTNLVEDTTPQLGGHLDLNGKNIQGDAITIESETGTEDYITCVKDGAVTLFHDAASKLATAATGVTVTGLMSATTIDGAAGANLQLDFGTLS